MALEVRVVQIDYGRENPYHALLGRGLAEHGVTLCKVEHSRHLLARAIQGHCSIIHLHWLDSFVVFNHVTDLVRPVWLLTQCVLARLSSKKLIWTVHNLQGHDSKPSAAEVCFFRCVVKLCNAVVIHGESAKPSVTGRFHIDESIIHVVPHLSYRDWYPNSVSRSEARAELNIDDEETVLLAFGAIRPYKGLIELIEATRRNQRRSIRLVIAGRVQDPSYAHRLEAAAKMDARIDFRPGFVNDEQVQTYMNAANAVVCSYTQILTSGAVVLAMSFGRACLAPASGCVLDVLDERGGVLAQTWTSDGLDRGLKQLLAYDSATLDEMGRYNLAKVERWTPSRVAELTANVYRSVIC